MPPIDPVIAAIIEELRERLRLVEAENARLRKTVEEQAQKIDAYMKRNMKLTPDEFYDKYVQPVPVSPQAAGVGKVVTLYHGTSGESAKAISEKGKP